MDTVLVPVDGSDAALAALEFALAEFSEAEILVLHVAQVGSFPADKDKTPAQHAEEEGEEILAAAEELAREYASPITTEIIHGEAANTIVSYAEEQAVDGIVLGSRGKSGIKRLLLGSTAEKVIRRSSVPVTVTR